MTVPGLVIRAARPADDAAIGSLNPDGHTLADSLARSILGREGGGSLVAEVEGDVVGHAMVAGAGRPDGGGEVALLVHPAWRGRGVGRMLLLAAIDWARRAGLPRIWVQVALDNAVALSLYRSCDLRLVSGGSDVITLERRLR